MARARTTAISDEEMIGKRFEMLVVIGADYAAERRRWLCRCDCGNEIVKYTGCLHRKTIKTKSCGCFDAKRGGRERPEMIGKKFNRLLVVKYIEDISLQRNSAYYKCLCDCGKETVVSGGNLRSNAVKSCGCLRSEATIRNNKNPFVFRQRSGGHKPAKKWQLTEEQQRFVEKHKDLPEKLFPNEPDKIAAGYIGLCSAVHSWFAKPDNEKINSLPDFRKYATAAIYNVVAEETGKQKFIKRPRTNFKFRMSLSKIRDLYYCRVGENITNECLAKILDVTLFELQGMEANYKLFYFSTPISRAKGEDDFTALIPSKILSPLEQLIEQEQLKIAEIKKLRMDLAKV